MKHIHAQSLIVHRNADPTVDDNLSRGFAVESEWYNGTKFFKLISFDGLDAIWSMVSGGVITNSTIITTITDNSNYNDSYGNSSPSIGGIFNTTLPSGINEGDYYIEPFATDGMPKHKIECKRNASGNLILIKIPYLQ